MYSPSTYVTTRNLVKDHTFFNSVQPTTLSISGPSDSAPIVNQQNSSNSIISVISLGILYILARPLVLPMWLIEISKSLQPRVNVS